MRSPDKPLIHFETLSDRPRVFRMTEALISAAKARNKQSMDVSERIQDEDHNICESVQKGLSSRAYGAGRLSVRREAGEQLRRGRERHRADRVRRRQDRGDGRRVPGPVRAVRQRRADPRRPPLRPGPRVRCLVLSIRASISARR